MVKFESNPMGPGHEKFSSMLVRQVHESRKVPVGMLSSLSITRRVALKPGRVDIVLGVNKVGFGLIPTDSLKRYMRGRFVHRHKGKLLRRHPVNGNVIELQVTRSSIRSAGKTLSTSLDVAMTSNYVLKAEDQP